MSDEPIKNDGANAQPKDPSPKRPSKKWPIVVGVVVAVLVVAGAGMWVWHGQPSFCGAICHTPMAEYLETYESTPGQPSVDKAGNEVTNASASWRCPTRTSTATPALTATSRPWTSRFPRA